MVGKMTDPFPDLQKFTVQPVDNAAPKGVVVISIPAAAGPTFHSWSKKLAA
jgi:hypothetical protein